MKLCTVFSALVLGCVLFFGTPPIASAADTPQPADVIIFNAKVITVNSNFTIAQAIAVRGDQIVAVGKDRPVERLKGPNTRMIDAHGSTVMPGLCDSDVFSYPAAVSESNAPSPLIHSIAEGMAYIRRQAAEKPSNAWIIVERAYPTRLTEGRLPTKTELDAAAPKHPVYWNCGSLTMLNSKALSVAKITTDTTNPPGGEVVLDITTRQPTGLLRNAASLLKLPVIRPPSPAQRREALKHLYQLYNEQGITSISEGAADSEAIDLFRDLSQSNELTVRINCTRTITPGVTNEETLARLTALTNAPSGKLAYGPTGVGDDWVRIGPLKIRMDGDLVDGTAYLRTPWGIGPTYQIIEPAYRGELYQNPEALGEFFLQIARANWQISADCTGDASLDQLLNCYQQVQFKTDIRQRRFLINHASFQAEQDWSRCKQLGLVASMQPAWLYCDGGSLEKTLGEKRLKNFLAFKSWFDNQLTIGGGSDHVAKLDSLAATNPWNPWLGIWITLARQTEQGAEIWPEEKLKREQAIQMYTINNAYLSFDEKKKGSLETGKLADLIMIDKDILKCPVDDVRQTKVQLTMVGGKIVWEAK